MGTNYIAPIWRMPRNANKDKLSNYSINLGGTNEYIDCGNSSNLDITGALTISFWIYGKSNASLTGIISKAPNTTSIVTNAQYHIEVNGSSNGLRFVVTGVDLRAGTETTGTAPTLTVDQWQHFVMTWNGTNEMIVYKNGVEVATKNQAKTIASNTNSVFLGRRNGYGYLEGQLSQACIFNYALDSTQVTYLYNLNNPMAITGGEPVAYWPLGDSSNPNAPGSFPNISVGADSVFDFNASEYIDVPDSDSLSFGDSVNDSPFSMSAWIKTTNGSGKGIISKWGNTGTTGYEWLFWLVGPNKVRLNLLDGINTVYQTAQGNTSVNTGEWVHVVATYDGRGGDGSTGNTANQGIKIYVNGVEDTPYSYLNNGAYTAMHNTARQVQIGAYNSVGQFDGEISNAEIWGTELTAAEVTTLYNNGQPLMTGTQPEEADLKAWWKLNQSANWNLFGQSKWTTPDSSSPYTKSFSLDSTSSPVNYFNTSTGPRGMTTNVGTYSCWVNLNSVAGDQVFIDIAGFASREYLGLRIRNNNALQMIMQSWSVQMQWDSVTTTPFEIGKWYHVVAVGDGTNIKMYINGEEISTYVASGSYKWWSSFNTSIAHNSGNRIYLGAGIYPTRNSPLNGRISNAQIWNTNLSSSQIETLYNNGKPLQGTQPAQTNLLAWYKLNQDSTWTNYNYWNNVLVNKWNSKNSAITTTPPTESFGFSGSAQDGDFEGWEVTNKSISGSLLLSYWYKTTGDTVFTWTFNNDGSGNTNAGKARMQGNGYIYFFSPNGSNYFYRPSVNIGDYNWHNLIIYIPNGSPTYDANDINLWLDGVELGKPTIVGSTTWDAFTEIKGMNRNSSSSNNGTGTQWSNWALFENVTPSDSVIDTIFNAGTPGDISSLSPSIWYKLDNTDTTFATTGSKATALSITDSSSNNNNATGPYDYDAAVNSRPVLINGDVQNAITGWYMDGSELENFSVSTLNGKSVGMNTTNLVQSNLTRTQPYSNYSINFDANSIDYIQVANPGNIIGYGENAFTFSGWINADAISAQDGIFGRYQDSSNRVTIKTGITSPYNGITLQIQNGATNGYSEWTNIIATGQWYHICAVYDGSQGSSSNRLKLYLNGVDQGTRSTGSGTIPTTTTNMTSTTPLDICNDRRLSGRLFDGKVSNYCVFDRILTDAEILKIYNNGITQDLQATSSFSNNILAWWPMDANNSYYDGTNWTVRDLQGGKDGNGINTGNVVGDMTGTAPGSEGSGLGVNLAIEDLKGNMYNSDKNAYSINMADYADGVTNPANSGRSTDTP